MGLTGTYEDGVVVVAGDARQRFHDARGYGYPLEGNVIALAPMEAAHLLERGDLESVTLEGTPLDHRAFLDSQAGAARDAELLTYADLRGRGYYLVPAAEPWIDDPPAGDLAVFERGSGPPDGPVEYAVTALGETASLDVAELDPGIVLAVADGEGEVSYFAVTGDQPPAVGEPIDLGEIVLEADLLDDRVAVWDPPASLYERWFVGSHLGETGAVQCSLVEAAYLAERGVLAVDAGAVRERGRALEGDRFDRRYTVYEHLRDGGAVPKTGFKFGADFRVYPAVESVTALDHSSHLVRVVAESHEFGMRDIARNVRLAHGVRKTIVVAAVADGSITWRSLERLTP